MVVDVEVTGQSTGRCSDSEVVVEGPSNSASNSKSNFESNSKSNSECNSSCNLRICSLSDKPIISPRGLPIISSGSLPIISQDGQPINSQEGQPINSQEGLPINSPEGLPITCVPISSSRGLSSEVRVNRIDKKKEIGGHQHVIVLPRSLRNGALRLLHNVKFSGHLGVHKTSQRVRERYYWVGMTVDIREWVTNCNNCQKKQQPKKSKRAPMKQYNVGAPLERLAIDILGPLPESIKGNKYIVCIGDYFTKWVSGIAIPDQEANTVAEALIENVFCIFGLPRQLHSDQGRNFESQLFQEACKLLDIEKTRTTGYRPQSDGMIERFMRTVASMLRNYVDKRQDDWDSHLPYVLLAYNTAEHESTGYSPFEMVFGRCARLPVELVYGSPPTNTYDTPNEYVNELKDHLESVHKMPRENLQISSDKHKRLYDTKSDPNRYKFQKDDLVWYYNDARKPGVCPKLTQNWHGPYQVTEVITDILYRIVPVNPQRGTRSRSLVVHIDKLKGYRVDNQTTCRTPLQVESEAYNVSTSPYASVENSTYETKSGRASKKPKWFGITW